MIGVPWARHGAGHTLMFDDQVAWLAVHTSKTAVAELMRIAWRTVGAIVARVGGDARQAGDRLAGLRRIGIDELSYVVDGDAEGVEDLAPGKIMFATSEALGRVVRVERKGGDRAVTLAPVELTDSSKLGLTAQHSTAAAGLKVDFDIQLLVRNLRVSGDIRVTNGVVPHPSFRVDGIEGLAVTVAAGAQGGLSDNKKAKIEVKEPIIIGGFPATLKPTFKFLVETAFTAKNGNLKATGRWGLAGPIGYAGASVLAPTFSVQKSIVDSLRGVSIGVEAIVVVAEFRFGFMIGLPVAGAGPFVGVVASLGLTNGSAAGRVGLPLAGPAVKCRGSTLVLAVRAGEGISMSEPLAKAIKEVLKVEIPQEADFLKKDIVNRTVVEPDVPLCRG
ncbi:hypothetical protein GCM10010429_20870 [Micromonospora olivasterospora]